MASGTRVVDLFTKLMRFPTPDKGFDAVGGMDVLGRALRLVSFQEFSGSWFFKRISTCADWSDQSALPEQQRYQLDNIPNRASNCLTYPLFGPLFLRTSSYAQL